MGKPVGIGMAEEVPSSTAGTVRVATPGVTRRVKKGNQAGEKINVIVLQYYSIII